MFTDEWNRDMTSKNWIGVEDDLREFCALSRWDNEGGASGLGESARSEVEVGDRAQQLFDNVEILPASHDGIDESTFLTCLGAAVISEWRALPLEVQNTLFNQAAYVRKPDQFACLQNFVRDRSGRVRL
jgi:hypothetical protein